MVFSTENFQLQSEKELLYSPIGEAKTNYLIGNYELAAKHVFQWYDDRVDYLTEKGSPSRDSVYEGEGRELADAMNHHYEAIKANRNENIPWYDDPTAKEIWSVASEAADVAIVMASELKNEGADQSWIVGLWKGAYDQENFFGRLNDYRSHIRSIRETLASIGVDLAEAIILKSALNEQHYPKEFWPWVMIQDIGNGEDLATFAKRFRKEVGPRGISQMFDLSMTRIGETNLSRAERSPFGSNGSSPKAIYLRENGDIELATSDMDHTHGGLYVVGAINWLCDDGEHRFSHEARRADFRWYYSQPDWRNTITELANIGIKEFVVPSGSNYRYEGMQALAKYIGMDFENLGQVDDELRWRQYVSWCERMNKPVDIFDFQRRVVQGKESRLDLGHDENDREGEHKGVVVAMDEIIVWFNKDSSEYEAIERPENEEDAMRQIDRLINGEQFFISNATIVTALQQNGMGEGLAMQIIPMRIKCDDLEERNELREKWFEAYRMAVSKKGRWKVTPGGVSMLHDLLQPYQVVTIYEDLDKMVMPEFFNNHMHTFLDNLVRGGKETPFLELSEKVQNEIGIAVGGLSMAGLRVALERFLVAKEKYERDGKEDHDRLQRLEEIKEIMRIGSEEFAIF